MSNTKIKRKKYRNIRSFTHIRLYIFYKLLTVERDKYSYNMVNIFTLLYK